MKPAKRSRMGVGRESLLDPGNFLYSGSKQSEKGSWRRPDGDRKMADARLTATTVGGGGVRIQLGRQSYQLTEAEREKEEAKGK